MTVCWFDMTVSEMTENNCHWVFEHEKGREKMRRKSKMWTQRDGTLAVAVNLGVPLQQHDRHQWMIILCWLVFLWLDSHFAQHVTSRDWCDAGLFPAWLQRVEWYSDDSSPARLQILIIKNDQKQLVDWIQWTSECAVGWAASGTQHGVTGTAHSLECCLNTKRGHRHAMSTLQWWLHLTM